MTGFGTAARARGQGRVVVEVRSVNARTLDVRVRLPDALGEPTVWAEQIVRRRLRRGRVEVSMRIEGAGAGGVELDKERASSALASLSALAKAQGLEAAPLSLLASVPGLFVVAPQTLIELRDAAEAALADALEALDLDRAREGAAISADLVSRVALVRAALDRARELARGLPAAFKRRLEERLARADVAADPLRLETEVALFADRSDVAEEISRLGTHLGHMTEVLAGRAEAAEGRRLEFLLLEMLREAGTLAAKAQDAAVSREVVEMKVELERMREQVQNVE
jgi:uncharacterized protein (TIGR00255 family)